MLYVILTIILIGIGLFIVSFFFNDRMHKLEEQLEQFSLSSMQDTYQIKKKLKVLEEELLVNEPIRKPIPSEKQVFSKSNDNIADKPLVVQKIYHLHEQGFSLEDIAKETNLSTYDVQTILKHEI